MSTNSGRFEDAKAGELCDLELECEGVKLTVHKIVVWNRSEESRTNVVQIPDFSLATVKRMVEYMYLGDYTLGNELKWDLRYVVPNTRTRRFVSWQILNEMQELAGLRVDTSSDLAAALASDHSPDLISITESANDPTDSTPLTTAETLRPHLEMRMIAGYYLIPGRGFFALEMSGPSFGDVQQEQEAKP
ncbi:uncharacterized protein BP01DRAFT_382234 [Aspergillus saccharolyticus JOP 1030-1]|uniref:BTB domain-containing protein n=1 Tax=Aspergillus saccharolyticus JOP 1030-1 TaxID=1450539 RepID=A0A318ZF61_9EURO|nr:hypothetical protein BP01DRAFT_382234 [Aspergillus saccharolyticus JOP 1030-1]PYH46059.1 hypothetical protein BP01DRAFT_382234 [Aspergillus saccharolyticus JOP 1030-1]